ncbi:MAG: HNH endonuclease [Bacteroidota bacterium]
MRPVERGPKPIDPKTDAEKVFSAYQHARRDLIQRLGQYCSYCETRLNASLAVEHVRPKKPVPALALEWDNFLLECTNCNSTKGDKNVVLTDYYWPDRHNTFIPFVYSEDGKVEIASGLGSSERSKAQAMANLVGLQKYPNDSTASDRRWSNRKEIYQKALRAHKNLIKASTFGPTNRKLFLELLITLATSSGFFSVWFSVFEDQEDVLEELLAAFPGTHLASFDEHNNFSPLKRTTEM